MSNDKKNNDTCDHCQEKLIQTFYLDVLGEKKSFCCNGCLSVFKILNCHGMQNFYNLRANSDQSFKAKESDESFLYLDHEDFMAKYIEVVDGSYTFEFFVEGIHCAACLWLLEKLPELCDDILKSKLNMSTSVLKVTMKETGKLSSVAKTLSSIGYPGYPILQKSDKEKYMQNENRRSLIRIGVAFAAAGNIMLYSFAVYFGASGFFKYYFNLFSFICALPVYFYCAIPFYRSVLKSIKTRTLSIDIPIVLALALGLGMGIYSLFTGADYIYFDTLSILVFLLLLARYSLHKAQQHTLSAEDLSSFMGNNTAKRKTSSGDFEEVLSKFIEKGDQVKVGAGELIPVDGVILIGESYVNNSLLTGEVKPEIVKIGDTVFMGAKNLDHDIEVKVLCKSEDTRLGKILQEIESGWTAKSNISLLADKVARRFISIVFGLSIFFFFYFLQTQGLEVAIIRCLTLLIITCPCALALTTPLALILGLSKMAKHGVLIRSEFVIELLANAKNIFLDKTGTLTYGEFHVESMKLYSDDPSIMDKFYSVEHRSSHPIALSVIKFLESSSCCKKIELESFTEHPGAGPSAIIDGITYNARALNLKEFSQNEQNTSTQIGFYEEDKLLVSMQLSDQLREGAASSVQGLQDMGLTPYLLSGDNKFAVADIAAKLSIKKENVCFSQSPEEKQEQIKKVVNSIMVGDGANDAVALKEADVGIAVSGSAEVSLRAADVYLSRSGIVHVHNLILASKFILKLIFSNLIISTMYNIVGVYLAFTGQVSPLVAAILMPLSSFTVLLVTVGGMNVIQKVIKEKKHDVNQ